MSVRTRRPSARRRREEKARESAAKKREKTRKAQERRKKEQAEKRNKAEVRAKEQRQKEKQRKKEKADKAEKAQKLKEKKQKETKAKEAEKALKAKVREAKEKIRLKELAEKKQKEKNEKAKEKADKAEKAAKETLKKQAIAKERERKLQCQKKKASREREIKSDFPKQISISQRGGWTFFGNPYAPLSLYAKGNICQLEGRLRKTRSCQRNCVVAKLNDHRCRPPKTLRFTANHDGRQVAISVTKDGFVRIGAYQPAWVSLSGIMWTRANYMMESTELLEVDEAAGKKVSSHKTQWSGAIQPLNGWVAKEALIAHKHGNLCVLAGQLDGQSWLKPHGKTHRFVAKLPANCRPFSRMMFSAQSMPQGRPLRVDLLADGHVEIVGVEGRPLQPTVILDGIVFSTVEGTKLKLNAGFDAFGAGYQTPEARAENGICHLQGLVKGSLVPRKIADLPEWCRPQNTLTFNSPYNDHVLRLDVTPNGEVWLKSNNGSKGKQFISVSSVTFPIPYVSAYGAIMSAPCK